MRKDMIEFRSKINSNGRVVLPAKCRQALHLSPGEEIIIKVEGERAIFFSVKHAVKQAQNTVKKYLKGKKNLSQQLIKMRRDEANHE